MADIIPLHERMKKQVLESDKELREAGIIYRVLFVGRDRRSVEIASRTLARAFIRTGFYARFDEPMEENPSSCAVYLRLGREIITECGFDLPPGLLVTVQDDLPDERYLQACDDGAVLLVRTPEPAETLRSRTTFSGPILHLPVSALSDPEPWYIGASCAGAAARLIGEIPWTAVEDALREELTVFEPTVVNRNLARGLEAFDRMAPWAGMVTAVEERVREEGSTLS